MMSMIELLPPKQKINVDLQIKLEALRKVTATVMYELAQVCGCDDCKNTLLKGIIEKKIIQEMTIRFIDSGDVIKGTIVLTIDWNKMEIIAKSDIGLILLDCIDDNLLYSEQLDYDLYEFISEHVERLRKEFNIKKINSSYRYVNEIENNREKYEEALKFLNHSIGDKHKVDTTELNQVLIIAMKGLEGILTVGIET